MGFLRPAYSSGRFLPHLRCRKYREDGYESIGKISGVSLKILIRLNEPIDFLCKVRSRNENPLFLRFKASAVTLSGSQAGNTCPFPALKAGLSPSCSPRWVPHCSQRIFAQKQWVPFKTQETPGKIYIKGLISLSDNGGLWASLGHKIWHEIGRTKEEKFLTGDDNELSIQGFYRSPLPPIQAKMGGEGFSTFRAK